MLAYFFIISGLIIMLFGIIGMIILPGFLLRVHSSTKCGVTGALNILIGFMIHSGELDFLLRFLLIILFLFFTAPIIAHTLAVFHLQERNIETDTEETGTSGDGKSSVSGSYQEGFADEER